MIGIVSQASNIKKEEHPEYTKETFLLLYPQFRGVLPDAALDMYVDLGLSCVNYRRFNRMWKAAIGLFIAHFCTLYLQSMQPEGTDASQVLAAASSAGMVTSESADGVSYSRDGSALNDLNGWAAFKMTTFGVQFATMAKLVGRGGMYVW
nr:MAG TPA: head to tail adaptor [Caudoviricetes sp.]